MPAGFHDGHEFLAETAFIAIRRELRIHVVADVALLQIARVFQFAPGDRHGLVPACAAPRRAARGSASVERAAPSAMRQPVDRCISPPVFRSAPSVQPRQISPLLMIAAILFSLVCANLRPVWNPVKRRDHSGTRFSMYVASMPT